MASGWKVWALEVSKPGRPNGQLVFLTVPASWSRANVEDLVENALAPMVVSLTTLSESEIGGAP